MSTKFKSAALKALTAAAALTLALTGFAPAAHAAEVTVSTQEQLRAAIDQNDVTVISLAKDIDITGEWIPAKIDSGRSLVIDGNGYAISNIVASKSLRGPSGTGVAGDGGSCDYYCGFIGMSDGDVTVRDVTFRNAEVDIKDLDTSKNSTGSSIQAVVVGNNSGNLVLDNVVVEDSVVRGYTKTGALVGFTQNGSAAINHCAIKRTKVVCEADGPDPQAGFAALVVGYDGFGLTKTNGVLIEDSKTVVDESVQWGVDIQTAPSGLRYVDYQGKQYGITCETYTNDSLAMNAVQLPVSVNGYRYETLADAVAAAENGDTVTVLSDLSSKQVSDKGYLLLDTDGQNISIDLQGHTVTTAGEDTISISAPNVSLTVKNGTVRNETADSYGLYVYKNSDNVSVTFEKLALDTVDQAVGVNGLNSNNNVALRRCVVNSDVLGVYWPPKSGSLTLENTTVEAPSGLVVKGGSVSIVGTDTLVKANGPKVIPEDYYDGNPDKNLVCTGDAIYVESGYNDRDIDLKVSAGSFLSENGYAVQYFQKDGETSAAKRSIQLSGGVYSTSPAAEFVAGGFVAAPNDDGTYSVVASSGSAEKGDVSGEIAVNPSHPALKPSIKPEVGNALAQGAVSAGESLLETGKVEGMAVDNEKKLAEVAEVAKDKDAKLETTLSFGLNLIENAPADEAELIEQSTAAGEKTSFLDISVVLNVAAVDKDGKTIASASSGVTELEQELEITVSVLDADLTGSVRLARVHEGVFELIPCTVDVARGTITFKTDRFSTYVLLTSDSAEVTFESNGGSAVEKQTVKFGEKVAKPADPTRAGFTFGGWYADKDLTKSFDFDKALDPKSDEPAITIYAKWVKNAPVKPIIHKVTFVPIVRGDEKIVVEVKDGDLVTLPDNPTYEGYMFAGWFLDEGLKKPFKADETAITSDLTLYGGWYKDGKGDTVTPDKPKVDLPKTGDDSMLPIAVAGVAGAAAVVAGIVIVMKRRNAK